MQFFHFRELPQANIYVAKVNCWLPILASLVVCLASSIRSPRFSIRTATLILLASNVLLGYWLLTAHFGRRDVIASLDRAHVARGSRRVATPPYQPCSIPAPEGVHYLQYISSPLPGVVSFDEQTVVPRKRAPSPDGVSVAVVLHELPPEPTDDRTLLLEFEEVEGRFLDALHVPEGSNDRKYAIWLLGRTYVIP